MTYLRRLWAAITARPDAQALWNSFKQTFVSGIIVAWPLLAAGFKKAPNLGDAAALAWSILGATALGAVKVALKHLLDNWRTQRETAAHPAPPPAAPKKRTRRKP